MNSQDLLCAYLATSLDCVGVAYLFMIEPELRVQWQPVPCFVSSPNTRTAKRPLARLVSGQIIWFPLAFKLFPFDRPNKFVNATLLDYLIDR